MGVRIVLDSMNMMEYVEVWDGDTRPHHPPAGPFTRHGSSFAARVRSSHGLFYV